MIRFLLLLLGVLLLCSCLAPYGELQKSAVRALESGALMVARFEPQDDEAGDAPKHEEVRTTPPPPFAAERRTAGAPTKRKRVTPFISKKVAARQGFKCAMCGELLQEDWEIDHIVSLQRGGSNELNNYQALHKRCHTSKSSEEQRHKHPTAARAGRAR